MRGVPQPPACPSKQHYSSDHSRKAQLARRRRSGVVPPFCCCSLQARPSGEQEKCRGRVGERVKSCA